MACLMTDRQTVYSTSTYSFSRLTNIYTMKWNNLMYAQDSCNHPAISTVDSISCSGKQQVILAGFEPTPDQKH